MFYKILSYTIKSMLLLSAITTLLQCKAPKSKEANASEKGSLAKKATFIVHLGRREKFFLNYTDQFLDAKPLLFSNPGNSDTVLVREASIDRLTHVCYSSIFFDQPKKLTIIEHHFLVHPGDTVELKSLHTDIAFTGVSQNKKFAESFIAIDSRVPSFKLKRYNFNVAGYNRSVDSAYASNIKNINNAYKEKVLTQEEQKELLSFNQLYIANQFAAPLLVENKDVSQIDYHNVNFAFIAEQLPLAKEFLSNWNFPLVQGYVTYKAFADNNQQEGLTKLHYLNKEDFGELYNACVLKLIQEHPAKNTTTLKHFIDSFAVTVRNTPVAAYLDSLKRIYYELPSVSPNKDMGMLYDINGELQNFNSILAAAKDNLVMVDLWASWCGPCRRELPYMAAARKKFAGKAVKFISISIDNDESVSDWVIASKAEHIWEENNYRFKRGSFNPLLHYYGIMEVPRYMLFDKTGHLISDNFTEPTNKSFEVQLNKYLLE